MLYNRPEVWMFCGFFLVSDMLASAYDVVSPSYRINITSTHERSDPILFHLLCKLDSLVFSMAGPV